MLSNAMNLRFCLIIGHVTIKVSVVSYGSGNTQAGRGSLYITQFHGN